MVTHSALLTFVLLSLCDAIPWSNIKLIPSSATFTHFVYMIADNNLDADAVTDVEEMRQNTATKDELNLVVYIDRVNDNPSQQPNPSIFNIYNCDSMTPISGIFGGSKILQKIEDKWCEIYDFGREMDSRESVILSNFTGLMSQFELTSTYFMLEFWDHGSAYSGFGQDVNPGSNVNTGLISLISLIRAIRYGLQMTHLGRLDILGFDACIMADYSELRYIALYSVTKYYVASEVSEPGNGWDYLNGINAKSKNEIEYAISIIDAYVNQKNVQTADSGAGYTLALFDMDYVQRFLNDFDSLVRMMTLAIDNYDYGMIMAILRAQSSTIYAEESYKIQDLGLFLTNLVCNRNIFFNSCNERLKVAGKNTLQSLTQSIVHFNADFVRKDTMTGSTIFWSYDNNDIANVYSQIPDLSTTNYLRFVQSMRAVLTVLSNLAANAAITSQIFTNTSCSAVIPHDLSFHVFDGADIEYSSDYGYKISKEVVTTTMKAETYLFYPYTLNDTAIFIAIADLKTNIVDSDFETTESITYWDGTVVQFVDINNNSNSMFSTGSISFTYDSITTSGAIPTGYIAKYPVNLYGYDDTNLNESVSGYIQFEVILGDDDWKDANTDMELYAIRGPYIEPIPTSQNVYIEGVVQMRIHDTLLSLPNGLLNWVHLAKNVSFYPFSVATIGINEADLFGNVGESMVNVMTNTSYKHIESPITTATMGPTATTPGSTTTVQTIITAALSNLTTSTDNKIESKPAKSGLDAIPTLAWSLIVISLFVVIVVLTLFIVVPRRKKGKAFISKTEIRDHEVDIEMGDEPLHTAETNAPVL